MGSRASAVGTTASLSSGWTRRASGHAATAFAEADEAGAVAAMVALLMGLRAAEIVSRVVRDLDDDGRLLWIPGGKTRAAKRTLQVPAPLRPFLLEFAEGREPDDLLFGYHDRGWVREWVQRICRQAKVPVVCAHAMRGLHSTLAIENGVTSHAVAAALGHESISTTMTSYARPEAVQAARQERVVSALSLRNETPNFVPQRSDQEKGAPHSSETPSSFVELNGIEPSAS